MMPAGIESWPVPCRVAANIRSYTGADALPGAIVSIRTAGEFLNWYYGAYSNAHRGKALRRQAFTLPNLRSAT